MYSIQYNVNNTVDIIDGQVYNSNQIAITMSGHPFEIPMLACLIIVALIVADGECFANCGTNSTTVGCVDCTSGSFSMAFNRSQQKYTCIDNTAHPNCIAVVSASVTNITCVQCSATYLVDNSTNACALSVGCAVYSNGKCIQCQSTNYYLDNNTGTCYIKHIPYCINYTVDTTVTPNALRCVKCMYDGMDAALNCTYNSTSCLLFDYQLIRCRQCPTGLILHSDGHTCYLPISNCIVYDNTNPSACLLCRSGYYYNNNASAPECLLSHTDAIKQQILSYNYTDSLYNTYTYTCLINSHYYNTTTSTCTSTTSHCLAFTNATNTTCAECAPGYYLSTSTSACRECGIAISYCTLCASNITCTSCMDGYYVMSVTTTSTNTQTKCMPCSSYKCRTCATDFTNDNRVYCLTCPPNTTLYAGSCITCSTPAHAYSISQSKCIPCTTIPNCRYCTFTSDTTTPVICIQCYQNYYVNNSICSLISNTTIVTMPIAAQILPKSAPGIQRTLYNDRIALMGACLTVDGFVCKCDTLNLTSLCTNLTYSPNLTLLVFDTYAKVAQYADQLRMAAQFPSFNYSTQMTFPSDTTTNTLLSEYQLWNVLSAYTYVMIRSQADVDVPTTATKDIITNIFKVATNTSRVFSDQKITILRGNGFYFKYIPTGLRSGSTGDDDYIFTSLDSTAPVIIYVRFNRLQVAGFISGTVYISTNNSASMTVQVRKTRHANYTGTNTLRYNGSPQNNITVNLTDGYLSIANFPKTTTTSPNGVQVYVNASDTTTDIYQAQRIQNIFYSESWLYILFFIALYLIFIPLCAIVDCCQPEQYMRKKVGSQEQGPEMQSDDTTVLRVNYRDFFPLYNVGNTPRPRRLQKVCLFIVNMQHIITFLTLIYFNLPGGLPVAAIALVIPGYLCTIVMGYIVGALFRILPGNMKYLVNLFSLGYWILWIFLMKIMNNNGINSKDYRLYILVFSILSFFLDMVIDALETLLVYFAIKQQEKQVSLFNCLAKWLSLRGYYQFDKLAKQLGNPSQ